MAELLQRKANRILNFTSLKKMLCFEGHAIYALTALRKKRLKPDIDY